MKIMENSKIFLQKGMIVVIVLLSVFLVGMKDVNAYDSSSTDTLEKTKEFAKSLTQDNLKDLLVSSKYIVSSINHSNSNGTFEYNMYYIFPNSSFLNDAYFFKGSYGSGAFDMAVEFKTSNSNRPYFFVICSGIQTYADKTTPYFTVSYYNGNVHTTTKATSHYANFDVKDKDGNLLFHRPLVAETEVLPTLMLGEMKMIIPVAVGLLGLLILSIRLLPGLKIFFRG